MDECYVQHRPAACATRKLNEAQEIRTRACPNSVACAQRTKGNRQRHRRAHSARYL